MKKLSSKHRAFADYFIECGNQTEAAKKAGYSERSAYSTGNRLMKNAEILAYIAERTKPTEEKRIATADDVMIFLTAMMKGEIKDAFGLDPSNADRISAAKELMKRHNVVGDSNKDALEKLDNVLKNIGGVI